MVHDALEMLVVDETDGGVTEVDELGDDVIGEEMNESSMRSEADVDKLEVVVTVERYGAVCSYLLCGSVYALLSRLPGV